MPHIFDEEIIRVLDDRGEAHPGDEAVACLGGAVKHIVGFDSLRKVLLLRVGACDPHDAGCDIAVQGDIFRFTKDNRTRIVLRIAKNRISCQNEVGCQDPQRAQCRERGVIIVRPVALRAAERPDDAPEPLHVVEAVLRRRVVRAVHRHNVGELMLVDTAFHLPDDPEHRIAADRLKDRDIPFPKPVPHHGHDLHRHGQHAAQGSPGILIRIFPGYRFFCISGAQKACRGTEQLLDCHHPPVLVLTDPVDEIAFPEAPPLIEIELQHIGQPFHGFYVGREPAPVPVFEKCSPRYPRITDHPGKRDISGRHDCVKLR